MAYPLPDGIQNEHISVKIPESSPPPSVRPEIELVRRRRLRIPFQRLEIKAFHVGIAAPSGLQKPGEIVEAFVDGPEFTVAVTGHAPPRALPALP